MRRTPRRKPHSRQRTEYRALIRPPRPSIWDEDIKYIYIQTRWLERYPSWAVYVLISAYNYARQLHRYAVPTVCLTLGVPMSKERIKTACEYLLRCGVPIHYGNNTTTFDTSILDELGAGITNPNNTEQ